MDKILDGKVALITGGGSGIGKGIAEAFAKAGASVAISGRRKEVVESEAAALAKAADAKTLGIAGDVSKPIDAKRMITETVERFGRLDILVNNAGIFRAGTVELMDEDDIFDIVTIDLNGPIYLCKYAYPHLKKHKETGGASVINISTSAALNNAPSMSVYGAAKAGLNFFSKNVAKEWATDRIRVNCICPGVVETPIFETVMPKFAVKQALEQFEKMHPLGRIGKPEDIANAALFFASPQSEWITGTVVAVDGGISLG